MGPKIYVDNNIFYLHYLVLLLIYMSMWYCSVMKPVQHKDFSRHELPFLEFWYCTAVCSSNAYSKKSKRLFVWIRFITEFEICCIRRLSSLHIVLVRWCASTEYFWNQRPLSYFAFPGDNQPCSAWSPGFSFFLNYPATQGDTMFNTPCTSSVCAIYWIRIDSQSSIEIPESDCSCPYLYFYQRAADVFS